MFNLDTTNQESPNAAIYLRSGSMSPKFQTDQNLTLTCPAVHRRHDASNYFGIQDNDYLRPQATARPSILRDLSDMERPLLNSPNPDGQSGVGDEAGSRTNAEATGCCLKAIPPPSGYEELDWRPKMLKTWVLVVSIFLNLGLAAGSYILLHFAGQDLELRLTSENAHIICTYAPAIVATITTQLYRSICGAVRKILPYQAMADEHRKVPRGALAKHSVAGTYSPWSPLVKLSSARHDLLYNLMFVGLVIAGFLIAAKVILFTSKGAVVQDQEVAWTVVVSPHAAHFVGASYLLMTAVYVIILLWMSRCPTGLRWDPASLQDELAMISQTYTMDGLEELLYTWRPAGRFLSSYQRWRIGYWERQEIGPNGEFRNKVVYGIACLSKRRTAVTAPSQLSLHNDDTTGSSQSRCKCTRYPHCRHGPRKNSPASNILALVLRICAIFLMVCIIAGSAYIAVKGWFISGFTMAAGPYVPGAWIIVGSTFLHADNPIPALLLRALPVWLVGVFVPTVIQSSATTVAFIQNIINMTAAPALAADTVASEDVNNAAYEVIPDALEKGFYRVAFLAVCDLLTPLLPIAVAGFFFISSGQDLVHVTVSKVSYFSTISLCILFLIGAIWSWPREEDKLPRNMYSLADRWTLCRGSRFLQERHLDISEQHITKEIFQARMLLLGNKYQLGFYTGTDGVERFGFDVVETDRNRPDWSEELCNTVEPLLSRSRATYDSRRRVIDEEESIELQPSTDQLVVPPESPTRSNSSPSSRRLSVHGTC